MKLTLLIRCLVLVTSAAGAQVDQVFRVPNRSNQVRGGCAEHMGTLNQWTNEAAALAQAGAQVLRSYETSAPARRLAQALLGLKTKPGTTSVSAPTYLNRVLAVFDQLYALFSGNNPDRGFLFCDSTWMLKVSTDSVALAPDGTDLWDGDQPMTVLRKYGEPGSRMSWYLAPDVEYGYILDPEDGGTWTCQNGPTTHGFSSKLVTENRLGISVITLCPLAFTLPDHVDTLSAQGVAIGDSITNRQPKSLTLLHEAIHVLKPDYLEGEKEYYGFVLAVKAARINDVAARKNPDNLVYFALAAWMLQYGNLEYSDGTAQTPQY